MSDIGIAGLLLVVVNIAFSYKGFTNALFFDGYKFEVDRILLSKDYKRLLSSGFLHVSWMDLIFNMLSLYAFSGLVENQIGSLNFLLVYFSSLIAGNLFALFVHRHHGDYSSVGASGAVCGIIFASIALFPGLGIGFFGLPFSIPSWLYGILYIAYSIYGIKSQKDNIGHEAHLGGALIGMLTAIIIRPNSLTENYLPILLIALPTTSFIFLIIRKPETLLIDNYFFKTHSTHQNIDHKFNEKKLNKQKELDKLLDKISRNGMESLSDKEKRKLDEFSK
jgi:membrane associated rhomboid family serine protease